MRTLKQGMLSAIIASTIVLFACNKDDKDNNILTKNGLPFSGAQEVPARATSATGTADVTYNKSTKVLTYTLNWNGLTTIPTISHIHGTAAPGVNAGIKHDFSSGIPKTVSGTFSNSTTIDGVSIKEDSLLSGFYYFNIHTSTYPGGEIRAQITF